MKQKIAFLVASGLLLSTLFVPYFFTVFTAPQYPDRSPQVYVYADRLRGDLAEWKVVSWYIGVKFPPELPEFNLKIIPIIILFLSTFVFLAAFGSGRWKKTVTIILLVAGISLAGWAQYRLYQAGHNLDPTAPMRYAVKPFTPPLIGIVKVHKITIYHLPHAGSVLFGMATALTLYTAWRRQIRANENTNPSDQGDSS